jgi:hypothetical protein
MSDIITQVIRQNPGNPVSLIQPTEGKILNIAQSLMMFLVNNVDEVKIRKAQEHQGKDIVLPQQGISLDQVINLETGRKKSGQGDVVMTTDYFIEHISDLPPPNAEDQRRVLSDINLQREPGAYTAEIAQNSRDATKRKAGELVVDFYIDKETQEYVEEASDNGTGALREIALLIPKSTKAGGQQVDLTGFFGTGKFTIFEGIDRLEIITNNSTQAFQFTLAITRNEAGKVTAVRLTGVRRFDPAGVAQGVTVRRIKSSGNNIPELDQMLSRRAWKTFCGMAVDAHFKIYLVDAEGNKQLLNVEKEHLAEVAFVVERRGEPGKRDYGSLRVYSTKDMPLQIVDAAGLRVSEIKDEYLALVPAALRRHLEKLGIIIQIPLPLIRNRSSFEHENELLPAIQRYVAIAFYRAIAYKTLTQTSPQFVFEGFPVDWETNDSYWNAILPETDRTAVNIAAKINDERSDQVSNEELNILLTQPGMLDKEKRFVRVILLTETNVPGAKEKQSLYSRRMAIQREIDRERAEMQARLLKDSGYKSSSDLTIDSVPYHNEKVEKARNVAIGHEQMRHVERFVVNADEYTQAEKQLVETAHSVAKLFGLEQVVLLNNEVAFAGMFRAYQGKKTMFLARSVAYYSAAEMIDTIIHELAHYLEELMRSDDARIFRDGFFAHQTNFTHDSVGTFAEAMKYVASVYWANQIARITDVAPRKKSSTSRDSGLGAAATSFNGQGMQRVRKLMDILRNSPDSGLGRDSTDSAVFEYAIKFITGQCAGLGIRDVVVRMDSGRLDESQRKKANGSRILSINETRLLEAIAAAKGSNPGLARKLTIVYGIIRHVVENRHGKAEAFNFVGIDAIWNIVGFSRQLGNERIFEHELREVAFRKQGLNAQEAHERVEAGDNPFEHAGKLEVSSAEGGYSPEVQRFITALDWANKHNGALSVCVHMFIRDFQANLELRNELEAALKTNQDLEGVYKTVKWRVQDSEIGASAQGAIGPQAARIEKFKRIIDSADLRLQGKITLLVLHPDMDFSDWDALYRAGSAYKGFILNNREAILDAMMEDMESRKFQAFLHKTHSVLWGYDGHTMTKKDLLKRWLLIKLLAQSDPMLDPREQIRTLITDSDILRSDVIEALIELGSNDLCRRPSFAASSKPQQIIASLSETTLCDLQSSIGYLIARAVRNRPQDLEYTATRIYETFIKGSNHLENVANARRQKARWDDFISGLITQISLNSPGLIRLIVVLDKDKSPEQSLREYFKNSNGQYSSELNHQIEEASLEAEKEATIELGDYDGQPLSLDKYGDVYYARQGESVIGRVEVFATQNGIRFLCEARNQHLPAYLKIQAYFISQLESGKFFETLEPATAVDAMGFFHRKTEGIFKAIEIRREGSDQWFGANSSKEVFVFINKARALRERGIYLRAQKIKSDDGDRGQDSDGPLDLQREEETDTPFVEVYENQSRMLRGDDPQAMQGTLLVCLAVLAYNTRTGERFMAHFLPYGRVEGRGDVEENKNAQFAQLLNDLPGGADWRVAVVSSQKMEEAAVWITAGQLREYLLRNKNINQGNIFVREVGTRTPVVIDANGNVRAVNNSSLTDAGMIEIKLAEISSASTDRNAPEKTGGIDLRSLPMVTQPVPSLGTVPLINPGIPLAGTVPANDKEWQQIENMLLGGLTPSTERIKEYLLACCARNNFRNDFTKVLTCIADILRLEEERLVYTEGSLKELIVLLEQDKPIEDFKLSLAKIQVEEVAPKTIDDLEAFDPAGLSAVSPAENKVERLFK